jgi:hypothetical protein
MNAIVDDLKKRAEQRGLTIQCVSEGHYKVSGKDNIVVNYWPTSKNRTAHVDGTKAGVKGCTPEDVIKLALEKPKNKDILKRKKSKVETEPSQMAQAFEASKVKGTLPWES